MSKTETRAKSEAGLIKSSIETLAKEYVLPAMKQKLAEMETRVKLAIQEFEKEVKGFNRQRLSELELRVSDLQEGVGRALLDIIEEKTDETE